MSKFPRIILITSISMITVGIILATVGFFTGAHFSIVTDGNGFKVVEQEERKTERFDLNAFENMEINTSNANIEIIPADKFELVIEKTSMQEVSHQVRDNTLVINEKEQGNKHFMINLGFYGNYAPHIKIYIPQNVTLKNVAIENGDGDVHATKLTGMNMKVIARYGDVKIANSTFDTMQIEMKDGDLKLDTIRTKISNITNNYGDISARDIDLNSLEMNVNDGDVAFTGLHVDSTVLTNKYGDINLEQYEGKNLVMNSSDGDIFVEGTLLGETSITNNYGDVKLKLTNKKSELNYTLATSYGDAMVNGKAYEGTVQNTLNVPQTLHVKVDDGDISLRVVD